MGLPSTHLICDLHFQFFLTNASVLPFYSFGLQNFKRFCYSITKYQIRKNEPYPIQKPSSDPQKINFLVAVSMGRCHRP
jgi:hypothetical protein